ncbi:hypothetical protein GCM10010435_49460 [Winogradskya consettensis]|uniref:Uncharacterized protein n=1 Tax=Winogradskya consettensis TaxID=113560 RepID=A0A919SZ05_9ACTN|nr:hypothetical protein Aco04nite_68380 [Actinoplanes consettensis]
MSEVSAATVTDRKLFTAPGRHDFWSAIRDDRAIIILRLIGTEADATGRKLTQPAEGRRDASSALRSATYVAIAEPVQPSPAVGGLIMIGRRATIGIRMNVLSVTRPLRGRRWGGGAAWCQ